MNNVGKNWDEDEEEKLIKEINKQTSITSICEKHQRHSGGIKARIRKILDDPVKSQKINDKTQIIISYFGENEKKLTKLNFSISLTEREVQLIELLFEKKKPLSKNFILQKIWKYSTNADTHTVETHVYRLRKKINYKFGDDNFILNSGNGYLI